MKQINLPKVLMPFSCNDLVRIGKDNDGGYLINLEDVNKTTTLLSFGVGEDISFERHFTAINKCPVIAYDNTVSNIHTDFFQNDNSHVEKNVVDDISFINTLKDLPDNVFLKCDIDGSEYYILEDIIRNDNKFSGISMEFHSITNYDNFNSMTNFISKTSLKLVHTHINNYAYINREGQYIPDVVELSFSSSDNISYSNSISLPNKLDMPNNPTGEDFMLFF
jgi:hypothetical protein